MRGTFPINSPAPFNSRYFSFLMLVSPPPPSLIGLKNKVMHSKQKDKREQTTLTTHEDGFNFNDLGSCTNSCTNTQLFNSPIKSNKDKSKRIIRNKQMTGDSLMDKDNDISLRPQVCKNCQKNFFSFKKDYCSGDCKVSASFNVIEVLSSFNKM